MVFFQIKLQLILLFDRFFFSNKIFNMDPLLCLKFTMEIIKLKETNTLALDFPATRA